MKKTILFLFGLFIFGLLDAQDVAKNDSWAEAKASKQANITVTFLEEDVFAYFDKDDNPAGVEIDIFTHFQNWLKNSHGVQLNINWVGERSFQKFYSSVQNGANGIIGLGTVTILDRRKSEVQFTPPWINNIAVLVSHKSATDLQSLDEINTIYSDKTAVVAKGTTLEGYMKDLKNKFFPDLKIETLPSQMDVVHKVAEDANYFAYMDLSIYWPALDREKLSIKRQAVGDLSAETFGFILPTNSDWSEPLNEFFNLGSGYRSNPAYRAILMKHLGGEVTKMLQMAQAKAEGR